LLIQVATPKTTHVIDCIKLGPLVVCQNLKEILMNSSVTKMFHDLHNDAAALASLGAVTEMKGTLDTQLAMEFLTGGPFFGFNRVFKHIGTSQHFSKR
jgi:ribonuclease D